MAARLLCSSTAWAKIDKAIPSAMPGLEPVLLDQQQTEPFDIAWCSFDLWADRSHLDSFFRRATSEPALRWLHTSAAGLDIPVYRRLFERGVTVTSTHVTGDAIAESVLRAVLDLFHEAERWRRAQRDHRWAPHRFQEVAGSTWLMVGMGAIGSAVATRANAFGANTIGVRRMPRGNEPVGKMVSISRLLDALPAADVVVVAVPYTPSTDTLVDSSFLSAMKGGSVLVNVARGSLVDEAALLAALDAGKPAAAVLDVFRTEPLPKDSPFWDHPRATVLPHTAALGASSERRAAEAFIDNLARWRSNRGLRGTVTADSFR